MFLYNAYFAAFAPFRRSANSMSCASKRSKCDKKNMLKGGRGLRSTFCRSWRCVGWSCDNKSR